jgi:recyclin-1
MRAYKPAEHEETTSVAPLLQFFELVHIGDMMQSMVQVYFDKELVSGLVSRTSRTNLNDTVSNVQAPHIDKTDFLNTVVREKKRFEDMLDDSVAAGLNMGTETLMNQVRVLSLDHNHALSHIVVRWNI